MDMNPVTLILLVIVVHDRLRMEVLPQDRGCGLNEGLVEEGGEGCDRARMVTEVGVCGALVPPREGSGVEIDLGVHYHNNHAYNQKKEK